jgi:hypothetical protein
MSTAALVMGILAVVSALSSGLGFVFGSLGIIFALLSRKEYIFDKMSRTGLALSIIGTVASIVALVVSAVALYKSPDLLQDTLKQFSTMYGYESTEELMEDFGYSFDFDSISDDGGYKL